MCFDFDLVRLTEYLFGQVVRGQNIQTYLHKNRWYIERSSSERQSKRNGMIWWEKWGESEWRGTIQQVPLQISKFQFVLMLEEVFAREWLKFPRKIIKFSPSFKHLWLKSNQNLIGNLIFLGFSKFPIECTGAVKWKANQFIFTLLSRAGWHLYEWVSWRDNNRSSFFWMHEYVVTPVVSSIICFDYVYHSFEYMQHRNNKND